MRLSQISSVSPATPFTQLPIRITHASSRSALLGHAACLAAAITGLAIPLVTFVAEATAAPTDVAMFVEDRLGPLMMVLIAMGLLSGVIWWSGTRLLGGLFPRQTIEITADMVRCFSGRSGANTGWWLPLSSYEGVTHHTRTTLSIPRQELILVHRKPSKSVLLAIGESISETQLQTTAQLLGRPIVPPARLYGL